MEAYLHESESMEQSFPDFDRQGRSPGIRPILHAALIFDPDFKPPTGRYQLPRLPQPLRSRADVFHTEIGGTSSSEGDREEHCENDTEEKRSANALTDAAQERDQSDQPPLQSENTHDPTLGDQTRWDAFSYQHGVSPDLIAVNRGSATKSSEGSSVSKEWEKSGSISISSSKSTDSSLNISVSDDSEGRIRRGRFAVTDEERELLDYEGIRGRSGNDALYTCTQRAASTSPQERSDEEFEVNSRTRWSL